MQFQYALIVCKLQFFRFCSGFFIAILVLSLDCGEIPAAPQNGFLSNVTNEPDEDNTYPPSTVATFECLPNFDSSGTSEITCVNTVWEQLSLVCSRGKQVVWYCSSATTKKHF